MAETHSQIMRGLIEAIMDQESDFRPSVESEDGAVGLMQVMPQYAHRYGYGVPGLAELAQEMGFDVGDMTLEDRRQLLMDPVLNERMGTAILGGLLSHTGGDLEAALTAYNMGGPAYDEWTAAGANPNNLDEEARNYASGVYGNYERMRGQQLPEFFHYTTPQRRPAGLLAQ